MEGKTESYLCKRSHIGYVLIVITCGYLCINELNSLVMASQNNKGMTDNCLNILFWDFEL